MSSESQYVRTIRIKDTEVEAYLDRMDNEQKRDSNENRQGERYPYRVKGCVVHLQAQGTGNSIAYLVPTRNISAGGMSFLHGGFVYPGTQCTVQLISMHGNWKDMEAVVARCEYIEASIHEVALKFKHEIDPAEYSSDAVKIRVLLVDDDPSVTRLAMMLLKQLNAEVDHAENGQIALELAQEGIYDVILMDMEMPVLDGFETVKQLREKGYSGVIIAATARTQPADKERCLEMGCDRFIAKPYQREVLTEMISSLKQEPLISSLSQDSSMTAMIDAFVMELPPKLRSIEEVFAKEDQAQLERLARGLKGEAGGYGFEPISAAAEQVEKAVIEKRPQSEIKKKMDELVKLCCLARSSARSSRPGAMEKAGSSVSQ
ncbi:MAG: response regulator [Phycisphaerae bacterium]